MQARRSDVSGTASGGANRALRFLLRQAHNSKRNVFSRLIDDSSGRGRYRCFQGKSLGRRWLPRQRQDRYWKNAAGAGNLPRPHPSKGGTKFSRHAGADYSCSLSPLRVQDEHAAAPRHAKVLFYVDQWPPLREFNSRRHIAEPISSLRRPAAIGAYEILSAWFLRIQSSTSLRISAASLPARSASP
jgi:hypothetical protein